MHAAISTTEILLTAMLIIFTIPYLIWHLGIQDKLRMGVVLPAPKGALQVFQQ